MRAVICGPPFHIVAMGEACVPDSKSTDEYFHSPSVREACYPFSGGVLNSSELIRGRSGSPSFFPFHSDLAFNVWIGVFVGDGLK